MVAKGASATFPLCAVAMEMAEQLEARQARLSLAWAPRHLNEEADAITIAEYDAFDEARRAPVDVRKLPWKCLPAMLAEGEAFHRKMLEEKAQKKLRHQSDGKRRRKRPKGDPTRLKWRDPW